ncbi:isoaspartyl peptidase/L-asparaginase [Myxococcota bacterium]|nr:isoaspartyl peptidase/L-asparaginase [Myxococcota bacterium]
MTPRPTLILHGGAGAAISPDRAVALATALAALARDGQATLAAGGSALDAVVRAVRGLEDDPRFNAGTGSKLQADGAARLSAAVMDGHAARFGGVVNVEGLLNPVLLARALMDEDSRVLAGAGALERARQLGLAEGEVRTAERLAEWQQAVAAAGSPPLGTGTVGAVALDLHGHLAAATSTGGRGMERPGRVSDTPTVAATFAGDLAAASLTGVGEHIVEGALAARLVTLVQAGRPLHQVRDELLSAMVHRGWQAGFVALDAQGAWATAHSTPGMSWWICGPDLDQGFHPLPVPG